MASRADDVRGFYELLTLLEDRLGGTRILAESDGKMDWPRRGVYFFFEPGEGRSTSGEGSRVVRIGTHALNSRSKTTLWKRLRQHRGTLSGDYADGGNHRGSIFRQHLGLAVIQRDELMDETTSTWSYGSTASRDIRLHELSLEREVSEHIRKMPLLWVNVDDAPGPLSSRGLIEKNAIALLSNYPTVGADTEGTECIDPPSASWLGRYAKSEKVSRSGLWNSNHVDAGYEGEFLLVLEQLILGRKP